jgi:hypothetical protein
MTCSSAATGSLIARVLKTGLALGRTLDRVTRRAYTQNERFVELPGLVALWKKTPFMAAH